MREIWFDVFEDQLQELHQKGFVHNDLKRPSTISGDKFDNIMLTQQGIRLIDADLSILQHQVGEKFFQAYIENELKELAMFKEYFLNR
jgi:serine/threonine protein kinase